MNRQQHLTGRVSVVDDEQIGATAYGGEKPYPLGIPKRMKDMFEKICHDLIDPFIEPKDVHEVTNLMPSDVPGVLIAAGIDEILASLGRIQRAKGFPASDAAYRAILTRALADGRDDIAAAMTNVREQLVRHRQEQDKRISHGLVDNRKPTTYVHDLMQQKADEAQKHAQASKMTEREMNEAKAAAFARRREQEAEREYLRRANEMDARRQQEKISDHLRSIAGTPAPGASLLGLSLQRGGSLNAGNLATMGHAPYSGGLIAAIESQAKQQG
jgi:hypothetical protein